jgi:hypothetical protein
MLKMQKIGLSLLLLLGTASSAAVIKASNPASVLNIAKGYGSATLVKDGQGDPKITGRIEGIKYNIYFYGCSDNKDCDSILFRAGWDTKSTLKKMNDWNSRKTFGRAYVDEESESIIEMAVNLDYDGVNHKNFDDTFDMWTTVLSQFQRHIN